MIRTRWCYCLMIALLSMALPHAARAAAQVTTFQRQTPVLIGNDPCPVLRVQISVPKGESAKLTRVTFNTHGTTSLADVASFTLLDCGATRDWRWENPRAYFQHAKPIGGVKPPGERLSFDVNMPLAAGDHYLWLCCTLKRDADMSHHVDAGCESITLDGVGDVRPDVVSPPANKSIGVALRNASDDGAAVYRIPGLITSKRGTLIAVYDIRHSGWSDLPANIDIGCSRSSDGGRTWSSMQVIMDMGSARKFRYDGDGDPSILVDRNTGSIFVAALWSHGNHGWNGSGPGIDPDRTGQLMMVRSDDDGATWSKPRNLTAMVKQPAWRLLLQGPGRGITMRDGTLVFPAQFRDAKGLPHSTILYSKDHGATWHIGTGAFGDTTESAVVEIRPGVLMLNCRYNRAPYRVVMTTDDLGETWTEHPTSRKALPEPGACMASLITLDPVDHPGHWLAFSNPHVDNPPRRHMTIQLSPDGGATWPNRYHLLLDEGPSAGYSCLTQIDDHTLGILYEGSRAQMTFQRIPLSQILAAQP